jgi:hypothetical protein
VIRAHSAGDELHHLLAQRRMIGSSEGRGAARSCQGQQPTKVAMVKPSRGTPLPDIDDLFTSTVLALKMARKKSREVYEKTTCKRVGSPDTLCAKEIHLGTRVRWPAGLVRHVLEEDAGR